MPFHKISVCAPKSDQLVCSKITKNAILLRNSVQSCLVSWYFFQQLKIFIFFPIFLMISSLIISWQWFMSIHMYLLRLFKYKLTRNFLFTHKVTNWNGQLSSVFPCISSRGNCLNSNINSKIFLKGGWAVLETHD